MTVEEAKAHVAQMRDYAGDGPWILCSENQRALGLVLARLAALERVAAAAEAVDQDAYQDATGDRFLVSEELLGKLHDAVIELRFYAALSALRDAQKETP